MNSLSRNETEVLVRRPERISVFDILKTGVGPSSSHTMGPWQAARRFLRELGEAELAQVSSVQVELYGSLAKTGKGHATDVAVQLGLTDADLETIDTANISARLERIAATGKLPLAGLREIPFHPAGDIFFLRDKLLPLHPNGLRFVATLEDGSQREATYYSIGGGFVIGETDDLDAPQPELPYPIDSAAELLGHCDSLGGRICDVVRRNERTWRDDAEIDRRLTVLYETMRASVFRGCHTEGVLPGGLGVKRRAAGYAHSLLPGAAANNVEEWFDAVRASASRQHEFKTVLDWVTCFALAVNEENAAMGRIVTAPTNGAAGVIPAVLLYYEMFCQADRAACFDFLLTAGEVGCLFKKGATISAAMGGCQAEIGVSSAMAAAALAEGLGGSPARAAAAAEIAMEHHLGMTCDPIGGLVQIPCIERNAFGAVKAITAAQMALGREPTDAKVSLDGVIRAMWETAQGMHQNYKETSEGGLAVLIPVCASEC